MVENTNGKQAETSVNGSEFKWDLNDGSFQFEGADVMLFWIDSAFKTFLDTIEEVAGEGPADLVFETAGYRTGLIVSGFFKKTMDDIDQMLAALPNIYASAGWGRTTIEFCPDERKATVTILNGWEDKVSRARGKEKPGTFLPGHWAGVFTGLLDENMWYEVSPGGEDKDGQIVIEVAPSEITPTQNIQELIQSEERKQIVKLEQMVEDRTNDLQALVKEISSPIIPITDHIVIIPLIGRYDENRAQELVDKTMTSLPKYRADFLVVDLTGISETDEYTITMLQKMIQAVKLLGTQTILVGISAELSLQITNSNFMLEDVSYFSTLKHGMYYALAKEGMHEVKPSK
ncbi:STAS domain-containing protein [Pseudalkalibacillus caeni]|uniref:STAS domain-containing protein n=1 Tax=Exobacillus caeni TaxID=2574798 RepID=A0A5R9F079_9BACL|nr:STAS domain-containing protein [Pseudalkalibacillus caeni]TLS36099.1 STAS domain-containing protein [Pseudalkalibacillus caeni]